MAKSRRTRASSARAGRLPTKAEIVDYIDAAPGRAGRREVARAFGITGADRDALKLLLREIRAERTGARRRHSAGDLPPVGLATVSAIDGEGQVQVTPHHDEGAGGALPLSGLHGGEIPVALGVGDRVLVRFVAAGGARHEGTAEHARLIRRLPHGLRRVTGIVTGPEGGPYRLASVSRRTRDDIALDPAGQTIEAGDLVTAETAETAAAGWPSRARQTARLVARHGPAGAPSQASLIAIHEHNIPHEFRDAAISEAEAAQPPSPESRADLRDIAFVTIDPADARDHDDAVHAAPDPDPANPGGWIVRVAIADVAHFVRPGTELDREARRRGNSVYFPDRVVPMLPERLSTDLCSLKPGEPRAALVARMNFDRDGGMRAHHFERAIMVSRADFTYEEAQAAIDGGPPGRAGSLVGEALAPLWAAYAVLARAREAREPLDLDLPERRVLLDAAGHPTAIVRPPRRAAHRLIEEFMIQANVATAETLERRRAAFLRRVHDAPAPEKADALGEYVQSLGFRFAHGQALRTSHFNRLIAQTAATPHGEAVAQAVLRAQSQALYEARDRGHFGLNLRRYAHFTSPIRRYADIIAHRALISALALGPDGNDRETAAALDEIAVGVSEAERRAMAAERDTVDRLVAALLSASAGAVFAGRVSGIVRSGLFVELAETGASGFVAAAALGRAHNDYFVAEDATFSLRGRTGGLGYRVGASVEIRLLEADPLSGALEFEMLTPPGPIVSRRRPPAGRGTAGRRRAGPRQERVR